MRIVLEFLNIFFFVFHTSLVIFNCFGWIFKKTRFINLITLLLTGFSWFILGIWYGWGFCFCTEWHWQIRNLLGYKTESYSYIHFLIKELTGLNLNAQIVDKVVLISFICSFILSVIFNIIDLKNKKRI